jgi:hypothetical protein
MPHGAGFYTLGCANCCQVFELPSLGDMNPLPEYRERE